MIDDQVSGILLGLCFGWILGCVVMAMLLVPSHDACKETGEELFQDYYACYMAYVCEKWPDECTDFETAVHQTTCAWAENYDKYYQTFGGENK